MAKKRAVLIIAHRNFRDEECSNPRAALQAAGIEVVLASSSLGEAKGMLGAVEKPQILVSDIAVADYDAIVFIGGSGASEYWDDPVAHRIAQEAVKQGRVLGAICIAPVTLARAGVLEGKRATVFPSEVENILAGGAKYVDQPVVQDGLIITGKGPEASKAFGAALVKALTQ